MKKILPLIIIVLLASAYFFFFSKKTPPEVPDSQADLILFWGNGCPHCEKVKEFISQNQYDSKLKISYKEVYYDQNNQKLLEETVSKCPEIDTSHGIGVPLAYSTKENKCLYGDTPIIEWLQAR